MTSKSKHMLILCMLALSIILSGCNSDNIDESTTSNQVKAEDVIVDMEFERKSVAKVVHTNKYIITTDTQTIVWNSNYVKWVESNDGTDKISYEKDDDGYMYEKTIHISPDGLKKYSKLYADAFDMTLNLKKE